MHAHARPLYVIVLALFCFVMMTPLSASAQKLPETNETALRDLANRYAQQLQRQRPQLFYDLLNSQDPAAKALNDDPGIALIRIRSGRTPDYYTIHNLNAAVTISTDHVWPGSGFPLAQTGIGTDPGELGIWDAGLVYRFHQEFGGRITQRDTASTHYHSTHVAGTMVSAGVVGYARGMSYEAPLDSYDWDEDTIEMALAAAAGMQISNHSYGWTRGWSRNIYGQWYWYGDLDVDSNEDYLFGFYDESSQEYDQVAHDAPYYLIVKTAGNDRSDYGPGIGGDHFHWDDATETWKSGTDYHQEDPFTQYDTIDQKGVAKNVLTVGAVEDIAGGYAAPGDVIVTDFSSFGPTDDGRIKPDLVANGLDVISTMNTGSTDYDTISGTSMAAPCVSGSLNLIARLFETRHGKLPLSSTLKALAIAGADEAGFYDGPDYVYGWGLMNTERTAFIAHAHEFADEGVGEAVLASGDVHYYYFSVPSAQDVRMTIAWTDPAGTPPAPSLNPTTAMLIHDLDVRVEHLETSTTYYPWRLNVALPANPATQGDNDLDNVEQVDIASAPAGNYVVRVFHEGPLTTASQAYSLIWQGLEPLQPEVIGGIDNGSELELRPNDAAVKASSSSDNQERGAFVTMLHDFDMTAAAIKLAATCPVNITANVYEATGSSRGALVATGTLSNAYHPGEMFYHVPISAALLACQDYEIAFEYDIVRHWWYWDTSGITIPFTRGGVVVVREGSGPGGSPSGALIHMDLIGSTPGTETTSDLTPPATAWSTCGDASDKRGVYVTPEKTLFVHEVLFAANYPAFADFTLRANIYSAVGTIRVQKIATGVVRPLITTSGMRDFHIPVNAVLREGLTYDVEVEFTPATWECKSEASFTLPFTIDGAIRVLDGEAGGNASNTIMPHIQVSWSDGAGGIPVDLAKPSDPNINTTTQSNVDYGLYVTAMSDQNVYSLGWYADIPEGETIGARVYEATGSSRGALIAAGSVRSSGPGERWHDVPVTVELEAGIDYDLEIEINGVNSFNYWLDFSGLPYIVDGKIRVRDGEQGGDASNALLLHARLNSCSNTPTAVPSRGPDAPPPFALLPPYPNPVTGRSRISYSLDRPGTVSIAVYDVRGRRVATLVDNADRPAGLSTVGLEATGLSSGIYFVRLSGAARSVSRKITVIR